MQLRTRVVYFYFLKVNFLVKTWSWGRRHLPRLPWQRYICRSKYSCFCLSHEITYLHTKNEEGLKIFISNFASLSWRIALNSREFVKSDPFDSPVSVPLTIHKRNNNVINENVQTGMNFGKVTCRKRSDGLVQLQQLHRLANKRNWQTGIPTWKEATSFSGIPSGRILNNCIATRSNKELFAGSSSQMFGCLLPAVICLWQWPTRKFKLLWSLRTFSFHYFCNLFCLCFYFPCNAPLCSNNYL